MKFECAVKIEKPIKQVLALFQDVENFQYWQDGFIGFEHVSGTKGEEGAITKYFYKIGSKELELTETILINDLPTQFKGLFESTPMDNILTSSLHEISDDKTHLNYAVEYTRFSGFMPKLMSVLLPGMFKKQTQKWLDQFKAFAEAQ